MATPEPELETVGNFAPVRLPTVTPPPLIDDPEPVGNLVTHGELPTGEPFRPVSIGNFPGPSPVGNSEPAPQIANVGKTKKARKHREAITVEPRVLVNGIAIYVRAAFWVDKDRGPVAYIQSTDLERLKEYEQQITKWAKSKNRRKPLPENALKNLGIDPHGS